MRTLTKKICITVLAVFMAISMIMGLTINGIFTKTVDGSETTSASLTLNGAVNKKDNVFYDVSFNYALASGAPNGYYGYWGTANGTTDAQTTIEFDATTVSRTSAGGEIMGIARGIGKTDADLKGYGFAYNGGTDSYATAGKHTKIVYNKTNHNYTHTQDGETKESGVNDYIIPTLEVGEQSNPTYTFILWMGGTYSAQLTNVQIYDENGWDLGVFICPNPDMGATNANKYAKVGETVTIKPANALTFGKWVVKDENGDDYSLNITDNNNGTYSFVMPSDSIEISAVANEKVAFTLNGAVNKKDNVFYNVSFNYALASGAPNGYYGYWGSANGTTDAQTTIEFNTTSSDRGAAGGATMGIARGTGTAVANLMGYGFAYNNSTNSYATAGKHTKIVYDKTTHTYTHTQNGETKESGVNDYIIPTLEAGEQSNPTHTFILWISGTYSAQLTDVQIYDENGWDLGVYVSSNPDMGETNLRHHRTIVQ